MAKLIGVSVQERDAVSALAAVQKLEDVGVPAAWFVTGGAGLDGLSLIAAASVQSRTIQFGTCIVPTFPRHPVVTVQQAQVVAQLAPGRFRLGLGPSHRPTIENLFGLEFDRPLEHLKQYVTIVRRLLEDARVDFQGSRFRVQANTVAPAPVPILISALRPRSFALAGEIADGAISWVTPFTYLREVAMPTLREAAERANRPAPPIIAHVPVAVHEDRGEVAEAARRQLGHYPTTPFYVRMFETAGFSVPEGGGWTDGMLDAVVVSGDPASVEAQLSDILSFAGEVIVTVLTPGSDRAASRERTLITLGQIAGRIAIEA